MDWENQGHPSFPEYDQYDGLGLAQLVRTAQVTPSELVESAIERIERFNPHLNFITHTMFDQARSLAERPLLDSPFTGVPFLLKDMYAAIKGVPTSCATRLLAKIPAKGDNEIVRRYRASGLIFLGRTNLSEFSLMPYTEPELFGPTRNPWDTSRTPGGSSGGSAVAVATGCVPLADAADGGGSIRIPASCCGIFGLKPSRGRTPTGPDMGDIWRGFAQEHVLTRSVRDSAAMLDILSVPEPDAPYWAPPQSRSYLEEVATPPGRLRIAFSSKPLLSDHVNPDCEKSLAETVSLLKQLGHELIEDGPVVDKDGFARSYMTMVAAETLEEVKRAAKSAGKKLSLKYFEPATKLLSLLGQTMKAGEYARALNDLMATGRRVNQFVNGYDAFLSPTLAKPPFAIGALQLTGIERMMVQPVVRLKAAWLLELLDITKSAASRIFDFIPYTPVFNISGQPAMSVPLYWNKAGLPIGVHFAGRYGDEATLFRLAGQLERERPWFGRRPSGH